MWSKFRFWIATRLLLLIIAIVDKSTFEGISLLVAIENWIRYVEENKEPD